MTTPHPRPGFDSNAAAHADLLTDLARVIPVAAGLAQIIGGAPTDVSLNVGTDPGRAAYNGLLTELSVALDTDRGLAAILGTESGLLGVVNDLSVALDTDRGLDAILATPGGATDAPVDTAADPVGQRAQVSADEPPTTPSTMDDLAALYLAPADQRLHLRAGLPSRAAHDALRHLENIRVVLAHISAGPHPLASPLDTAPTVLDRQRVRITDALAVMAQALPPHYIPHGAFTPTQHTVHITEPVDTADELVDQLELTQPKYLLAEEAGVEGPDPLDELHDQLQTLRRAAGHLSIRELARRGRMSKTTVYSIFQRSAYLPRWPVLASLLTALDVPLARQENYWQPLWRAAVQGHRAGRGRLVSPAEAVDEAKVQTHDLPEHRNPGGSDVGADENRNSSLEDVLWHLPLTTDDKSAVRVRASALLATGDIDGAERLCREAADRGDASALGVLGLIRHQTGDIEGAERVCREAVDLGDAGALTALARLRERAGDYAGAEHLYREAARHGDAGAWIALAQLRERAFGDLDGAVELYQKAADRDHPRALYGLAQLQERAFGDYAGASTTYRQAADRGDASALHGLARLRARTGDLAGAEAVYREAADRGDAGALHALAQLLTRAGDVAGTEAVYREAADRGHTDALVASAFEATEGDAFSMPSQVLPDAVARSASLLQQTADELAALYGDLVERPPSTAGVRLLQGCADRVDELTATVRQLWAALSDFRGADLRTVAGVAIERLDEVRWSDGTAGTEPTRWSPALALEVQKHSKPVDDLEGVWEIGFGAAISSSCG